MIVVVIRRYDLFICHALIDYMESDSFQPALTLPVTVITDLFTKTAPPVNMYTKDSPDELKPKLK